MRHLYDDWNPTQSAVEELILVGLKDIKTNSESALFGIQGKLGDWRFERRAGYWSVDVEELTKGLPLETAIELHNTVNIVNGDILGNIVRAGGHAGGICPTSYVANPVYDEEFNEKLVGLGYEKVYSEWLKKEYVTISVGEVAELCNQGKLDVQRYVSVYHIDTLIGLREFVKFIEKLEVKSKPTSSWLMENLDKSAIAHSTDGMHIRVSEVERLIEKVNDNK